MQASSAANGWANANAASATRRSPSPPESGAMILAQSISVLPKAQTVRCNCQPMNLVCQAASLEVRFGQCALNPDVPALITARGVAFGHSLKTRARLGGLGNL